MISLHGIMVPVPRQGDYSERELQNVRDFLAITVRTFGGQELCASKMGVSQATVAQLLSGTRNPGAKSLRALAEIQGVTIEGILTGLALRQVTARQDGGVDAANSLNMHHAARALAELYRIPVQDALDAFRELATTLPAEVPATTWFDAGRAAYERRLSGKVIPLRRIEE